MTSISAMDVFSGKVQKVIVIAKRDEANTRASWPASFAAAAVKELCGGAVFEVKKSDGSGTTFGYTLLDASPYGVTDAGVVGLFPPAVKTVVGDPDGKKSSFDGIVERWAPRVLCDASRAGRERVNGFRVDVKPLQTPSGSDPCGWLRIEYVDVSQSTAMLAAYDEVEITESVLKNIGHDLIPWRGLDEAIPPVDARGAAAFFGSFSSIAETEGRRAALATAVLLDIRLPSGTGDAADRDRLVQTAFFAAGLGACSGDAVVLARALSAGCHRRC